MLPIRAYIIVSCSSTFTLFIYREDDALREKEREREELVKKERAREQERPKVHLLMLVFELFHSVYSSKKPA